MWQLSLKYADAIYIEISQVGKSRLNSIITKFNRKETRNTLSIEGFPFPKSVDTKSTDYNQQIIYSFDLIK